MFPFDPPENIRKPKVDQKGTLGRKGLKADIFKESNSSNRQKMNGCFFRQISRQNMIWFLSNTRGGSRAAATSKMERFVIIVNGWKHYHKALHLGCCSSPRSASEYYRTLFGRGFISKLIQKQLPLKTLLGIFKIALPSSMGLLLRRNANCADFFLPVIFIY